MTRVRASQEVRASSEALLSGQNSSYSTLSTPLSTNSRSMTRNDTIDRGGDLTRRDGVDAPAATEATGRPHPAGASAFALAAAACGYDPASPSDAAAARADHRVWDLFEVGE